MEYVIYLVQNGEILRSFSGPEDDLFVQLQPGEGAVPGVGCWQTHRVVAGAVVPLAERRVPPADGQWWDASQAAWFDPLQRAANAAAATADRREALLFQIGQQERRQARPLREIELARVLNRLTPQDALDALLDIEARLAALRTELRTMA